MKRAAIYIRVSTKEQELHGFSIDSQLAALKEYCADNGMEIAGIYNDAGISAHVSYKKRGAMQQMIKDCQAGKIDIILVTKLDRFFRSVKDYYSVMDQIGKVPWRAIWEDYETESSSGIFKVNIMLSVAQAESDRTSERVKSVINYKKERGEHWGSLPIGYIRENRKIVKDARYSKYIDMFYESFFRTLSLNKAHIEVLEAGMDFSRYHCKQFLESGIYRGKANMEEFEAYVPEDKIAFLDNYNSTKKREPRAPSREYIFSGICKCESCGRAFSGCIHPSQRRSKKRGVYYQYYKSYICSKSSQNQCKRNLIMESTLEKEVLRILSDYMNDYRSGACTVSESNSSESEIKSIKAKLRRIADLYELGDICREEYIGKRDQLKAKLEILESSIKPSSIPLLPDRWREMYDSLSVENKRIFWQSIIKTIWIGPDKSVRVTYL